MGGIYRLKNLPLPVLPSLLETEEVIFVLSIVCTEEDTNKLFWFPLRGGV